MSEYSEKLCDEKHESLKETIETHERRLNDHADRLKKIENENVGTAKDVSSFKESLNRIEDSVAKIAMQLENIKEKPAKRWDGLIDKIITIIAGIVIGKFIK